MINELNDVYMQGSVDALAVAEQLTGISKEAMAEGLDKEAGFKDKMRGVGDAIKGGAKKVKSYYSTQDVSDQKMRTSKNPFAGYTSKGSNTYTNEARKIVRKRAAATAGAGAAAGGAGYAGYRASKD